MTLNKIKVTDGNIFSFVKVKDDYVVANRIEAILFTDKGKYKIILPFGFKCDGLSVPFAFRWFLPSWSDTNFIYNLAGAIHDALYGNAGFDKFTREECDDIFRGILRESSIGRFKAGCADLAVGWFGKPHFEHCPKSFAMLKECDD